MSSYNILSPLKTKVLGNPKDAFLVLPMVDAQVEYIRRQRDTEYLHNDVKNFTRNNIGIQKEKNMERYRKIFPASELIENETTISSFLIAGYRSAVI